jgi:hypothetical protein
MIDIKIDSADDIARAMKQFQKMEPAVDLSPIAQKLAGKTFRGMIEMQEMVDGVASVIRVEFPPILPLKA